jgi:hypothetical protein
MKSFIGMVFSYFSIHEICFALKSKCWPWFLMVCVILKLSCCFFWNCVFMVASLVSCGGCSETVGIKNGHSVFVVCNYLQRFAE